MAARTGLISSKAVIFSVCKFSIRHMLLVPLPVLFYLSIAWLHNHSIAVSSDILHNFIRLSVHNCAHAYSLPDLQKMEYCHTADVPVSFFRYRQAAELRTIINPEFKPIFNKKCGKRNCRVDHSFNPPPPVFRIFGNFRRAIPRIKARAIWLTNESYRRKPSFDILNIWL